MMLEFEEGRMGLFFVVSGLTPSQEPPVQQHEQGRVGMYPHSLSKLCRSETLFCLFNLISQQRT